jgi:hypothetical protein
MANIYYIPDPIKELNQDIRERHGISRHILKKLAGDSPPSVLGIFGAWGTGKSSLLNLFQAINVQEKLSLHIEIIDAWEYELTGNLFIPIVKFLGNLAGAVPEAKGYLKRLIRFTTYAAADMGMRSLTRITGSEIGLEDVKTYAQNANRESSFYDWKQLVDDIAKTQEDFAKLVACALEGTKGCKRLIICIDNLDRCSPENAISLLESIKNFFTVPNCVWVLALDSEVIASYVTRKYAGTAIDGYCYLDKIIPEQYHIPPISLERDIQKLSLLLDHAMGEPKLPFTLTNWKNFAQIPRVLTPRRLIKTARKFHESYTTPNFKSTASQPDLVFSLILLYHSWPEFYERLSSSGVKHVGGILANYEIQPGHISKTYPTIPMSQAFIEENSDLRYFLQQAFLNNSEPAESIITQLTGKMRALKQVGLP